MKTAEFKGTVNGKPAGVGIRGDGRRADFPAPDGAKASPSAFPATAANVETGWRSIKVNMRKADYDRIRAYCRERGQALSPFMRYAAVLHLDIIEDEPQETTWRGARR